MLSSMSPVGERARGQRWWITVLAYVVGSAVGGAAVGLVLGAAGAGLPLTERQRLVVWVAVAAVGLVLDAAGRVPTWHRQVDERWLTTYRGWVYGLGFGAQLGAGVVTIVPRSITLVVMAGALLGGSPIAGLAVGATFGLARSLPLLSTRRLDDPRQLRRFFARLARRAPLVDRGARLAHGTALAAALVVAL